MRRTAPETSVQLCMPGWSRVPAEKMLSGKTPGSVLGKQRHTTEKVRDAGCKETHCLPCAVFARSAKQRTRIPGGAAWGRKDDTLSGENSPCAAQTPAHIKVHLNDLEMKDSL